MKKIVLFGMMTNKAVAGIDHLTMPYLVGLERLGYETYYVEAHGSWPTQLQHPSYPTGDGSREAAAYIDRVARHFGFKGRWAFHAQHSDGSCYGMTAGELRRLYAGADLFLNLHGGTFPPEELAGDDRLVLIDSDPVGFQIAASKGETEVLEFLGAHARSLQLGREPRQRRLRGADAGRLRFPSDARTSPARSLAYRRRAGKRGLYDDWKLAAVRRGPRVRR